MNELNEIQKKFFEMSELQQDIIFIIGYFRQFDKIISIFFVGKRPKKEKIDFFGEYQFFYNGIYIRLFKHKELHEIESLFEELFGNLKILENINNFIKNIKIKGNDFLNGDYQVLAGMIECLKYEYNTNLELEEIFSENANIDNETALEYNSFVKGLDEKLEKYHKAIFKPLAIVFDTQEKNELIPAKHIRLFGNRLIINDGDIVIPLTKTEIVTVEELLRNKTIYKEGKERGKDDEYLKEISMENLRNITKSTTDEGAEKVIKGIRKKINEKNINIKIPKKNGMFRFEIFR